MQKLVVLTGPTAVGKSKLSIELAKRLGGEIISADSMQVYKYMNIGTDKISPEKMGGVPHHLIDFLEPTEDFNVVMFQKMVKDAIKDITSRGKVPILVGGTGFYIQAIIYDIDFTETDEDDSFRKELEKRVESEGVHKLFLELCEVDPKSAEIIHENNVKRVIRALEYYHKTGKPIKIFQFKKQLAEAMALLNMDESYAQRDLNVGFSGGEKKKAEILQLLMLQPRFAILDETDSGLDVDAVRTVSQGIREYQKKEDGALLIITHSTKILESLKVDKTHIIVKGQIVKSGGPELVDEINEKGFEAFLS